MGAALGRAFRVAASLQRMSDDALMGEIRKRKRDVDTGTKRIATLTKDMRSLMPKGFRKRFKWEAGIGKLIGSARTLFQKGRVRDGQVTQRLVVRAQATLREYGEVNRQLAADRNQFNLLENERVRRVAELEARRSRARLSRDAFESGPHVTYALSVLRSLEANHDSLPECAVRFEGFNRKLGAYRKATESYWASAMDPHATAEETQARGQELDELRDAVRHDSLRRGLFRAVDRWSEAHYAARTRTERSGALDDSEDAAYLCFQEAGQLDRDE